MRKTLFWLGTLAGLGAIALVAPAAVLPQTDGHVTAAALAGGLFTMALAVYIRE